MAISFEKYKKEKESEAVKEDLLHDLQSIDLEAALQGAIMNATGSTKILGVDYSLKKAYCEEQANKYDEVSGTIGNMITK